METAVFGKDAANALRGRSDLFEQSSCSDNATDVRRRWASISVRDRVKVLRAFRHQIAGMTQLLSQAISPELARTQADTRTAEILPLLAACQFLEQNAASILAVRRLARRGLPFWLSGVSSEIHRAPMGCVLIIGPSNYPLFLPGVQVLQALVAGNAVIWKPGRRGRGVADLFAQAMVRAGLPATLLHVTDESIEASDTALQQRPDKVFFTGSAEVGRMLMRQMSETLTPCVMELSGCDAVVVLPSANLARVVKALAFGMRLNGSATCMAPRRVLLMNAGPERRQTFLTVLKTALSEVDAASIPSFTREHLRALLSEAMLDGAVVHGDIEPVKIRPILVTDVQPTMRLVQSDVFAPVLSVIEIIGNAGVLEAQEICPLGLTASIFGDEAEARQLAEQMTVGSVLINDLIVSTADPRVPFGGRRQSGFGVTRGAEGLLEMTTAKVIAVRRSRSTRQYEATTATHETLFDGFIATAHAESWTERWNGLRQVITAGRRLTRNNKEQHEIERSGNEEQH